MTFILRNTTANDIEMSFGDTILAGETDDYSHITRNQLRNRKDLMDALADGSLVVSDGEGELSLLDAQKFLQGKYIRPESLTLPNGDPLFGTSSGVEGKLVTSVFSAYYHIQSLPERSTTSDNPQEFVTLTCVGLLAGLYRLDWNYCWRMNDNKEDFVGRILQDNLGVQTELWKHQQRPNDNGSNQSIAQSSFKTLTLEGDYTFGFWYNTAKKNKTASASNAEINLTRVG